MDEKYTLLDFVSLFMAWAETVDEFNTDPAKRLAYGMKLYQDLSEFIEKNPPIQ